MSRPVAVLRPEPGNAETVARIAALGLVPVSIPLFEVRALAWTPPDPAEHDALILTSANTLRLGGAGLATLRALPALAVGTITAEAARQAGFDVMTTGQGGADALLAEMGKLGLRRALHLGGRDRTIMAGGTVTSVIAVYASAPLPVDRAALAPIEQGVALLHSARAATRLAELAGQFDLETATIRLATLSDTVAHAAGFGWAEVAIADAPTDAALVAVVQRLAD